MMNFVDNFRDDRCLVVGKDGKGFGCCNHYLSMSSSVDDRCVGDRCCGNPLHRDFRR